MMMMMMIPSCLIPSCLIEGSLIFFCIDKRDKSNEKDHDKWAASLRKLYQLMNIVLSAFWAQVKDEG